MLPARPEEIYCKEKQHVGWGSGWKKWKVQICFHCTVPTRRISSNTSKKRSFFCTEYKMFHSQLVGEVGRESEGEGVNPYFSIWRIYVSGLHIYLPGLHLPLSFSALVSGTHSGQRSTVDCCQCSQFVFRVRTLHRLMDKLKRSILAINSSLTSQLFYFVIPCNIA